MKAQRINRSPYSENENENEHEDWHSEQGDISERTEQSERKKHKSTRKKGILVIKTIVVFVVIFFALFLLSASPLFSLSEIEVSGNGLYKEEQIIEKSGLEYGQNCFSALIDKNILKALSLRCSSAEYNIVSTSPYIKSVEVQYHLPDKITIHVEERSKSVVVPYFESGILIDEEGYVVDIIKNFKQTELPVVTGFSFEKYDLGKKLVVKDEDSIELVLTIINALRQADRNSTRKLAYEIQSIDVTDINSVKIHLKSGLTVKVGDGTDIFYCVSATKEIVFNNLEEGVKGIIDFSNNAKPVFIPENIIAG